MRNLKKINSFTFIFFIIMIFFTCFSKDLYQLTQPKVLTAVVSERLFPITFTAEDGSLINGETTMKAVPNTALYDDYVFVLESREDGLYLEPVDVSCGEEIDGWVSVESKLTRGSKIVIGADRKIQPGMKVLEVNNDGQSKMIYQEADHLPDGILFSSHEPSIVIYDEAFVEEVVDYEGGHNGLKEYAYIIKAKSGLEEILYSELIRNNPEAHVINFYMIKQLRSQTINFLWFLLILVVIHIILKVILKYRYKKYRLAINTLSFFIICFYIKNNILVPAHWIPSKLIDISGWLRNIKAYTESLGLVSELVEYSPVKMFVPLLAIVILPIGVKIYMKKKMPQPFEKSPYKK